MRYQKATIGAICAATIAIAAAELSLAPADGIAGIGKAAHAELAVFYMLPGQTPPKEVQGQGALALLKALEGKAQLLAFSHSTGLKDGDVMLIANDVLREGGNKAEDVGVDCEMILHVKNEEIVTVSGRCAVQVFDISRGKQITRKLIIKPITLGKHWTLVAYDEAEHVAIYMEEEIGTE